MNINYKQSIASLRLLLGDHNIFEDYKDGYVPFKNKMAKEKSN